MVERRRIPELDGLRGIAAFLVVIYHMQHFSHSIPDGNKFVYDFVAFVGTSSVQVFYVISGFIITSLLVLEKSNSGTVSLPEFYLRRFFRIIPAFAVYLSVITILSIIGLVYTSRNGILSSLFFISNFNFIDQGGTSGNGLVAHIQTLSVEEQFYVVFPLTFILLYQYKRKLLPVCVFAFYLLCFFSLNLAAFMSKRYGDVWLNLCTLYQFRHVVTGVLLALHQDGIKSFFQKKSYAVPVISFVLLCIIGFMQFNKLVTLVFNFMQPMLWAVIIFWVVNNPEKCALLRRNLLLKLGALSYSLYLWQQLFTMPKECYNNWWWLSSPLVIIPIVIIAFVSYNYIEIPAINLGRKVIQRRRDKAKLQTAELSV